MRPLRAVVGVGVVLVSMLVLVGGSENNTPTQTEVHTSLAVNQLAILDILSDIKKIKEGEQEEERERLKAEVLQLRQDLTIINSTYVNRECIGEEKLHVNDNCTFSVCNQGRLRQYQGPSPPDISFSELLAKQCIYFKKVKTSFDVARAECRRIGGDLFVAGDFAGMTEYLHLRSDYAVWMGVRDGKWLNGRTVTVGEWHPGQPGTNGPCAEVWHAHKTLGTMPCTNKPYFMCQKGISYP